MEWFGFSSNDFVICTFDIATYGVLRMMTRNDGFNLYFLISNPVDFYALLPPYPAA